jgi:hypothetical protein
MNIKKDNTVYQKKERYVSNPQSLEDFIRSGVCSGEGFYCAFSYPSSDIELLVYEKIVNKNGIKYLRFKDGLTIQ